MSDFSDSSQNNVISPATTFIENFHKKNGTAVSSASISPSVNTIGSTSPSLNGGVGNSSGVNAPTATAGSTLATTSAMGRQINTSSSSSSSVKETSSQQNQQSTQIHKYLTEEQNTANTKTKI